MMSILVTGINGFVGKHLARELYNNNIKIYGCGLDSNLDESLLNVVAGFTSNCDLTHPKDVARLPLKEVDAIINLAGLAQVGSSFGESEKYNSINIKVHTTVAEAIQNIKKPIRMVSVSTGAVYDNHQPMPLNETSDLIKEGSPYAQSKIAMENALQPFIESGMDVVIARPFNHIGPGQLPGFLVPDLARQIQQSSTLKVGNLKTRRDYTDVRDVARAYRLLATKPKLNHKIYNVCSGKSVVGESILKHLLNSFEKPNLDIIIDKTKVRPNDPQNIIGDNSRLTEETGWLPKIPLEATINDFVANLKMNS